MNFINMIANMIFNLIETMLRITFFLEVKAVTIQNSQKTKINDNKRHQLYHAKADFNI